MNGNKKSAKQYHQSVITALEKKVNDMKDSAYSGLYSENSIYHWNSSYHDRYLFSTRGNES